jgi:hypothetical protein
MSSWVGLGGLEMCAQANSSFKPNRCSAAHGYIRGAEANSYWQPAQGGSSTSAASQYPTLELVGGLLATAWKYLLLAVAAGIPTRASGMPHYRGFTHIYA